MQTFSPLHTSRSWCTVEWWTQPSSFPTAKACLTSGHWSHSWQSSCKDSFKTMQVNASYNGTIMCCDVGLLSLPKACDYGRCVLTAVTACIVHSGSTRLCTKGIKRLAVILWRIIETTNSTFQVGISHCVQGLAYKYLLYTLDHPS